MINEVEKYLEKYHMISQNDTIVAGVSGGADSICLLLLLHEYQKKKPFQLAAVHINHKIRDNAEEDAKYVKDMCDNLNIPFYLFEEDISVLAKEKGISTEEAGREVRYRAFNHVVKQLGGNGKIAVAHNQNDQAETVLFHLFRGTGLTGMSGILPVRDNIIRPLLGTDRVTIEEYLKKQNISWCIDSTNSEDTYTRNKIRNHILPYAEKEIVKNATAHIAATAEEMTQIREYFDIQVEQLIKEMVVFSENEADIMVSSFQTIPDILQRQVLLRCMEQLTNGRKDIGSPHILAIQELFKKTGCKEIHLPYQLEARKQYEKVIIRKKEKKEKEYFKQAVEIPGEILLPSGKKAVFSLLQAEKDKIIPQKTYTKWFDYDKILHCLVLRNRISGDYFTVNQNMERKKAKDYFMEEKIPREKRDDILLLTDDNHILWALGLRISEYYKVTKETKQILQVIVE